MNLSLFPLNRRVGPRLLRHYEGVRRDTNLAAERPVQCDDHHDDQREGCRERRGHRQVHAEAFVAEEIGVAGSYRRAEKHDRPNDVRDVSLHCRQPRAARIVELVPRLEHLSLDHRFTRILGMDCRDRGGEVAQRLPPLVGRLAGPLDRPFDVDHDADVLRQRVANLLPLRIRQARSIEIHSPA